MDGGLYSVVDMLQYRDIASLACLDILTPIRTNSQPYCTFHVRCPYQRPPLVTHVQPHGKGPKTDAHPHPITHTTFPQPTKAAQHTLPYLTLPYSSHLSLDKDLKHISKSQFVFPPPLFFPPPWISVTYPSLTFPSLTVRIPPPLQNTVGLAAAAAAVGCRTRGLSLSLSPKVTFLARRR